MLCTFRHFKTSLIPARLIFEGPAKGGEVLVASLDAAKQPTGPDGRNAAAHIDGQRDEAKADVARAVEADPIKDAQKRPELLSLSPAQQFDRILKQPSLVIDLFFPNIKPEKRSSVERWANELGTALAGLSNKDWFKTIVSGMREDVKNGVAVLPDLFRKDGELINEAKAVRARLGVSKGAIFFSLAPLLDLKKKLGYLVGSINQAMA